MLCYVIFPSFHQVADLLRRTQALDSRQQSIVESGSSNLAAYGLRRKHDFDKYHALALAEDLVAAAQKAKHEKANFLSAATRALRDRLDKSREQFQAYFMALFSDKDYSKVLDSIAKVDKSLCAAGPSTSTSSASRPNEKNPRLVCNFCGALGHSSPFCFKRRQRPSRGRFVPYQRSTRTRDNASSQ